VRQPTVLGKAVKKAVGRLIFDELNQTMAFDCRQLHLSCWNASELKIQNQNQFCRSASFAINVLNTSFGFP
jgi:hypothetical protein